MAKSEVSVEVLGLKELNKLLKALPDDFRTKALNTATRDSANVFKDGAKANVPKATGRLSNAITTRKTKSPSKWISRYDTKLRTREKIVISRKGKRRSVMAVYYGFIVEYGNNKGMAARPFMRTAFDHKAPAAIKVFSKRLNNRIKFYQRKLAKLNK